MKTADKTPARERHEARQLGDRIEVAVRATRLALADYSPRDRLVALAIALNIEERRQNGNRRQIGNE